MSRYIDADKIHYVEKEDIDGYVYSETVSKNRIDALPTEDVAPIVHGRWKMNSDYPDTLICSNCDSKYDVIWMDCGSNYCPHCGAKMEE